MAETAPALVTRLDQPLPVDLTGSGHGWFTRYRQYAVFSVPWARLRTCSFGVIVLLALLVMLGPSAFYEPLDRLPLGGFIQLGVQLVMPLLLGPWLGSRVRALGLPEPREQAALVAAIVATVLAVLAFHQFAAEPMKQRAAELTGAVDESGQRKRMRVAIGVIVQNPDDAAKAATGRPADETASPETRLSNLIASVATSFWLGGG
ncbi:MAG: sensor histidine kinase, partial [Leptothrix sp. (in: Bacteria)]|nr:sensor histidine kinase [Leptothrix sp. (in: b-proteobacteria)]